MIKFCTQVSNELQVTVSVKRKRVQMLRGHKCLARKAIRKNNDLKYLYVWSEFERYMFSDLFPLIGEVILVRGTAQWDFFH